MELVILADGDLEATYAPGAGMVGTSLRHRGENVLAERQGLDAYVERAKTFGIPLLHPWANRLDGLRYAVAGREVELDLSSPLVHTDDNRLPIHGLCSASPYWEVVDSGETALRARLPFGDHPDLLAGFPFPHDLEMGVALDPGALHVTTTLRPTGDVAVPVAFGFHPYLTLPGVERAVFEVTLPVRARGMLDARGIPTGDTEPADIPPGPLGDRTYDDLFPELDEPAEFVLVGGGRRIGVRFEAGCPLAQVWAPAGQRFICYEPMTAPTNALVSGDRLTLVEPDGAYEARFTIAVVAV